MPNNKFLERLVNVTNKLSKHKTTVMVMAVVVVFITTYLLILPAFTLEKEEAERQGGIDLPVVASDAEEPLIDDAPDTEVTDVFGQADETIDSDAVDNDQDAAEGSIESKVFDPAEDTIGNNVTDISEQDSPDALDAQATATGSPDSDSTSVQTEPDVIGDPLRYDGDDYSVSVVDAGSVLPDGTSINVEEIDKSGKSKDYVHYYKEALAAIQNEEGGEKVKDIAFARFYDITLMSEGQVIEPAEGDKVNVRIEYGKDARREFSVEESDNVRIVHFTKSASSDKLQTEVLDSEENNVQIDTDSKDLLRSAEFDAGSFSVYAVVYTVDFHWDVDGRSYEFNIPGGGCITLTQLVETLGITDQDVKAFAANVEEVEFSSPELVWTGKTEEDTTVGAIKDKNGLQCEYSADLTEEQITEINAQEVEAGDWVLISLKPFDTEETLTVTMKNGEVFEIRVTDAVYDATQISSITNGGTYALVNRANGNALTSAAHNVSGRLQAVGVTVSNNQITTPDGSVPLTKWTFTRVPNQTNQYYIQSPGGYLNMSTNGNLSVSGDRQAFEIQTNNGTIKINRLTGNYSVNNVDNQTANGYSGYNSNWNANPGEWFTLYEIEDPEEYSVTIHFVDRNGQEISGVTYSGGNPNVVNNGDGTFTIPYNWHGTTGPNGATSVHLDTDFSKTGYTYANTHLAGSRPEGSYTYDGLVIDAELKEKNNTLMFYSDCGNGSANPRGNRQYDNLAEYNLNGSFMAPLPPIDPDTNVGTTEYSKANENKDIYIILDPDPPAGLSPTGGEDTEDFDLTDPVYDKKLVSNGDGTYTLSLSITGRGKNISEKPKANVLFVVDTSSSMDSNNSPDTGNTRLVDTQEALKTFGNELLATNQIQGKDPDTIEVAMVSFDGAVVNELDWTRDYSSLASKIDGLKVHRGTDWEDGLKEAYSVASAKQAAEPNETTYVIFFTDGEPSNYTSFNGAGGYPGTVRGYTYWYSHFLSREAAKDEIRAIVSSGLEMYGIFAYNNPSSGYQPTGEKGAELLHNAIKYGFNTSTSLENSRFYKAENTSQLNAAFANILNSILEYADIHAVELNDNITDLTSVGITSNDTGSGTSYTAFKYTRSGGQYGSQGQVWEDAPPAVYDSSGVHWDLSSAGVLENGVTYKVSFVVWPSQEAYDWVADLNNDIKNWGDVEAAHLEDHFLRIPDSSRPSGYRYEVKTNPNSVDADTGEIINNQITYTKTHTSIVGELPEGAQVGVPFEDPETHIVSTYTLNPDGTSYTKLTVLEEERAFGPPEINMGLSDTEFKLEKIWTVNRPEDLVEFLYNTSTGDPLDETKNIDFDIYQGSAEHPDQERKYTTVTLGYNEDTEAFDWYGDTQVVHYGENDYVIGTIWEEPLDIAFGLMLSPPMMAARGLDSSDFKYVPIYPNEDAIGTTDPIYYVLERGHDYRLDEPELDYRFDFNSDVYHPMLVDSVPRDAKIHYIEQEGERTVGILESISPEGERLDALTAENILRGQLTLEKLVLDPEGNPDTSDNAHSKSFPFTVELYNEDAPFHDDPDNPSQQNVPWYGIQINGVGEVFYYYTIEDGEKRYTNEAEACVDGDYIYGLKDGYFGNIMTGSADYKTATATLNVSPRDKWFITNIPGGTQYTVTEGALTNEYTFVKAEEMTTIDDGQDHVERVPVQTITDGQVITGEIHSNHTTEIEYTNRRLIVPINIELLKIDAVDLDNVDEVESLSELTTLIGASFTLEKYKSSDYVELDTDWGNEGKVILTDEDNDGVFSVTNLTAGFYKIVETDTPTGYIKAESDPIFEVRRDANHNLQLILLEVDPDSDNGVKDADNNNSDIVKIRNQSIVVGNESGAELPLTGGIGTTIFYIFGSMLVIGCGIYLIARRRVAL